MWIKRCRMKFRDVIFVDVILVKNWFSFFVGVVVIYFFSSVVFMFFMFIKIFGRVIWVKGVLKD